MDVKRSRGGAARLSTFNWCRRTTTSASSRTFDLSSEIRKYVTSLRPAIIPYQITRSTHVIQLG